MTSNPDGSVERPATGGAKAGSPYEAQVRRKQELIERQASGKVVVWPEDRDWDVSAQGRIRYYLNADFYDDTCLMGWSALMQEIPVATGKHRHQGGAVIFALEGEGVTTIEDEEHPWEAGDLVILPLRPNGVVHQHINRRSDGKPALWFAFVSRFMQERAGHAVEQVESLPQ